MTRSFFLSISLLMAVIFLGTGEAEAAWPCTWAPGEYQVGEDRGVPLCEQRAAASQPSAPIQLATNYFAAAWHGDSPVVWMVAGYGSSGAAERNALDHCNKAMGKGCVLAQSSYNGAFALVIGMNGQLFSATDVKRKGAERRALDHCKKQGDICAPNGWMEAPAGDRNVKAYLPEGNPNNIFATAAWPKEPKAATVQDLTIYVSSGHASGEAAKTAALEFCQSQTGLPCIVVHTVASTNLVLMKRSDERIAVEGSPTKEMANKVVKERCPKGIKCTVTAVIPAWQVGNVVHKPFAAKPNK